jgi:16S rRNA (adenine1518-N6/adenine1519-N6)-dimethyltransferase
MKTTNTIRKTNRRRDPNAAGGRRDKPSDRPRPRKRFGQHFLEAPWVAKLVAALGASTDDTFLEVGPGRGALTLALAPHVARIVAVEIDRDLAAALPERAPANVRVVLGDFLHTDLDELLSGLDLPLRVVGNLPYNVASPILFRLLRSAQHGRRFRDATLMLQKEVADRLCAGVGHDGYGALAIQIGLLADVDRILTLPPGAFRPPPKVTSTVVRLTFRSASAEVGDPDTFEQLVRGLFVQRRKTLLNALRPIALARGHTSSQVLEQAGLEPSRRPETLTVHEMARLSRAVL